MNNQQPTQSSSSAQQIAAQAKQEEKNRKMLEELQRQKRQMMAKTQSMSNRAANSGVSGSSSTEAKETASGAGTIPLSATAQTLNLKHNLNLESSIMFIPINSQYGNNIIPVFPRIGPDT